MPSLKTVVKPHSREIIAGKAKNIEDYLDIQYHHFAKIAGNTYPHAIIDSIDCSEAYRLRAVEVVTYKDVSGVSAVGYIPAMPTLAVGKARFLGEPVAIVVAKTPGEAERAISGVKVEYRKLPALTSIDDSLSSKEVLIHDSYKRTIAYRFLVKKGNIDRVFSKADVVIKNRYKVSSREHAYVERSNAPRNRH
ncbi:MAG: hypothetical protein DRO13_01930 [Thermoprotei archaeon]|nr:MAG: hypothetical protein DRO13_01930 [Thermoprotei archaeon]